MDAESEVWDEIAERLIVIYNHQRLTRSDMDQHRRQIAKCEAELVRLDGLATKYEALLHAPDSEGTPAYTTGEQHG